MVRVDSHSEGIGPAPESCHIQPLAIEIVAVNVCPAHTDPLVIAGKLCRAGPRLILEGVCQAKGLFAPSQDDQSAWFQLASMFTSKIKLLFLIRHVRWTERFSVQLISGVFRIFPASNR